MSRSDEVQEKTITPARSRTISEEERRGKELERVRSVAAAALALKTLAGSSIRALDMSEQERSPGDHRDRVKSPQGDLEEMEKTSTFSSPTGSRSRHDSEQDEDDIEEDHDDISSSLVHMNFPRKVSQLVSCSQWIILKN